MEGSPYQFIENIFQDKSSTLFHRPVKTQTKTIRESIYFNCRIEVRSRQPLHPYDVAEFVLRAIRNQMAVSTENLKKIAAGFLHMWCSQGTIIFNSVKGLLTIVDTIAFDYETPAIPLGHVITVQHSGSMRNFNNVFFTGHLSLTATPVATSIQHQSILENSTETFYIMLKTLLGLTIGPNQIGLLPQELSVSKFKTLYDTYAEWRNNSHLPSSPPVSTRPVPSAPPLPLYDIGYDLPNNLELPQNPHGCECKSPRPSSGYNLSKFSIPQQHGLENRMRRLSLNHGNMPPSVRGLRSAFSDQTLSDGATSQGHPSVAQTDVY